MRGSILHTIMTSRKLAAIALVAAGLAYLGATSKARLDKRLADRQISQDTLAVSLRLRYEVALLEDMTAQLARDSEMESKLIKGPETEFDRHAIALIKKVVYETPGMDAAWERLHLFEPEIAQAIDELRRALHFLGVCMNPNVYDAYPPIGAQAEYKLSALAGEAKEAAERLRLKLDDLIKIKSKSIATR